MEANEVEVAREQINEANAELLHRHEDRLNCDEYDEFSTTGKI